MTDKTHSALEAFCGYNALIENSFLPAFKRLYHRARNAVEGRNATFKSFNLKRLPVYGQPRAKATIFLADTWLNLTTLARLVREATLAARSACT